MLSWTGLIWLLVSVWLFDLFLIGDPVTDNGGVLYFSVPTIIDCLLVWSLLSGICDYVTHHGSYALRARALHLRAANVILSIGTMPLQFVFPGVFGGYFTPNPINPICGTVGIVWIVWLVMVLNLVYRVGHEIVAGDDMPREDSGRPWQYSLRILLLTPVVLWLIILACFPKLMTGDFCYVRIDRLTVHENGYVDIACSTRTSSGTFEEQRSLPNNGGGEGSHGGFPAWPGRGSFTSSLNLCSDGHPLNVKEIRDRLLIEQGKSYRVVPGKPLFFYDFKAKDGTRYCDYIEVTPVNRLGL